MLCLSIVVKVLYICVFSVDIFGFLYTYVVFQCIILCYYICIKCTISEKTVANLALFMVKFVFRTPNCIRNYYFCFGCRNCENLLFSVISCKPDN